jgi:hypothetical protein
VACQLPSPSTCENAPVPFLGLLANGKDRERWAREGGTLRHRCLDGAEG